MNGPGLRERKKQRTRDDLVRVALELCERDGFPGTTLDALCHAADVSKRTFFRYFDGKEAVVLAPGHELWTAVIDDLGDRDLGGAPLLTVVGDAAADSVHRLDHDGWTDRLLRSLRLSAAYPSIETHGLAFCERTTATLLTLLHRRGDVPEGDLRPRLCLDLAIRAVNTALRGWAAGPGDPGADELASVVRRTVDALPGAVALSLGSGPTSTGASPGSAAPPAPPPR